MEIYIDSSCFVWCNELSGALLWQYDELFDVGLRCIRMAVSYNLNEDLLCCRSCACIKSASLSNTIIGRTLLILPQRRLPSSWCWRYMDDSRVDGIKLNRLVRPDARGVSDELLFWKDDDTIHRPCSCLVRTDADDNDDDSSADREKDRCASSADWRPFWWRGLKGR